LARSIKDFTVKNIATLIIHTHSKNPSPYQKMQAISRVLMETYCCLTASAAHRILILLVLLNMTS